MERCTNLLIICSISLYLFIPISSQSQYHYVNDFCLDNVGNYTTNSTYHNNLKFMLSTLESQASLSSFNNETVGQGNDQTFGLFMCRGDLSVTQCHNCITEASAKILEKCPIQKEAIVWFDECVIRYANRNIFSRFEEAPMTYAWTRQEVLDPENFGEKLSKTMDGLIMEAAYNTSSRGYATGQANVTLFETVYVLAQCTPDIIGTQCERCLRVALRNMGGCCGAMKIKLAMYLPSCWLRYDPAPIVGEFDVSPSVSGPSSSGSSDDKPSFDSDSSSSVPPPSPPIGSSNAATITSSGIGSMLGILMAAVGISLTTAL